MAADPKVMELNAVRALIKIHAALIQEAMKEHCSTELPVRRAIARLDEALLDCLRKAITELAPALALAPAIDATLTECEKRIAQRRRELDEAACH
jgi:hypothetical protein